MTPDELKLYVDSALKQREHFEVLFYVLSPIITLVGGVFVGSYLTEKGKNAATKEDVGKITTEIARSNQVFNESLERVKADLGSRSHYSKLRYEREMKVFQDIWPKLFQLRMAVRTLRPVMDSALKEGETKESRNQARVAQFNTAFKEFQSEMENNRPFYPPSIWRELLALRNLCWGEAVEFSFYQSERIERDYWLKAMENSKEIDAHVDLACEAIRTRLTEFDAV